MKTIYKELDVKLTIALRKELNNSKLDEELYNLLKDALYLNGEMNYITD